MFLTASSSRVSGVAGLLVFLAWLAVGCSLPERARLRLATGESVVLVGEEPARLAHVPVARMPIQVRSGYRPDPAGLEFVAGRDYVVDAASGMIRRTPGSRIPDFRRNLLFGQEDFDHSKFPGFGNAGFFAFVDYSYVPEIPWPVQAPQTGLLPKSVSKLKAGGEFRIVAFGDSITAGGDVTRPEWIFWNRWAAALQTRHPGSRITAVNGATGGDSTVQGLQRLQAKVLDQKPDLVLIGFGMNDHNRGGVPIPQFEANLREIVSRIRAATGAEVLLFSAFPPNPRWKFGSHQMEKYAQATSRAAAQSQAAFADVFGNWQRLASRKKPEDLLGNNINHPNDFGHGIYFQVLEATGL
jgi:lysophospholipase L1-like esterase